MDKDGRELVVLVPQVVANVTGAAGSTVFVTITFAEAQLPEDQRTKGGYTGYIRMAERPQIKVQAAPPPPASAGVDLVLASAQLDASSNIATVNTSVRQMASMTVSGDLSLAGRLTALNLCAGAPGFQIGAGKTVAGNTNWLIYSTAGVYVNVDTTAAGFTKTPIYVTALHGAGSHWATTGGTSVYLPTPTAFRIYVKWSDGSALTPQTANVNQWHIQWIGIEI